MLHLRPSDYRHMPWKDGGGSTTEIAIEPAGASLSEPFLWRVSSARVASSGPFSRFPGLERRLVLLEGAGFILDFENGSRQRLKHLGQVLSFSGDEAPQATLIQGPCLDFGVISDPARVKAEVQWLSLDTEGSSLTLAPATLLYAPWGPVQVDPLGLQLEPQDCLRLGGEALGSAPRPGSTLGVRATLGTTPLLVASFWPR